MSQSPCGLFVAFEGIDAAGKSTQARLLAERIDALLTLEPGGSGLGKQIRTLLLDDYPQVDGGAQAPVAAAEALLFAADRSQHLATVVAPALEAGRSVVSDRSYGSTLAYQGFGRQIAVQRIWELIVWASRVTSSKLAEPARAQQRFGFGGLPESFAAGRDVVGELETDEVLLLPDVVVLLELPLEEILQRTAGGPGPDRLEAESAEFLKRVADGYELLASEDAATEGGRWVRVDATGPPEEVAQAVAKALSQSAVASLQTGTAVDPLARPEQS